MVIRLNKLVFCVAAIAVFVFPLFSSAAENEKLITIISVPESFAPARKEMAEILLETILNQASVLRVNADKDSEWLLGESLYEVGFLWTVFSLPRKSRAIYPCPGVLIRNASVQASMY